MNALIAVLSTIAVFLIIITIHEFGHFIAAKSLGVLVHEFAIGMGPAIFKWKGRETQYSIRCLPIGGYVKMEGEDEESNNERSVNEKPLWARFIIVFAGAFLNIIMGLMIFLIIFMRYPAMPILDIDNVVPGMPAYGQIQAGDKIVAINGTRVWYYKDFMITLMQNKDAPVKLTVNRGGSAFDTTLSPALTDDGYKLGISFKTEDMTPLRAIKYGIFETFSIIRFVLLSFFMMITGKIPVTDLSGPVGASTVIGEAAKGGLLSFLNMAALLSVNVGIFNIIPIPALDGGRIFFMLIELIRGKPINPKREGMIHAIGLILLLCLMFVVTSSDIYKLVTGTLPK